MMKRISACLFFLAGIFLVQADQPIPSSPEGTTLNEINTRAIYRLLAGRTPDPATLARLSRRAATITTMKDNIFVKNPSNWAASVDLTCLSIYNDRPDSYGFKFQTTAISPCHGIGPAHTAASVGAHFSWLAADGTTVTRTIVGRTTAADDIEIYLFSSDLPSIVKPAQLLPPTWARYLGRPTPSGGMTTQTLVLVPTQETTICCGELGLVTGGASPLGLFRFPMDPLGRAFSDQNNGHQGLWSGDSGFTAGMLINGAYVPIVEWHYGGSGTGPFLAAYDRQINAAMHQLSQEAGLKTDYQISPVDLSNFPVINASVK